MPSPTKRPHAHSQQILSNYFSPSSKKTIAGTDTIDLTCDSDDDQGHPYKRRKTQDVRATPTRQRRESPAATGTVDQWKYTPSPEKAPETQNNGSFRTDAEKAAAKKRHEAFKKKLLNDNNRFLRTKSDGEARSSRTPTLAPVASTSSTPVVSDPPENSGEVIDQAFQEFSQMFSHKSTKRKRKPVNESTSASVSEKTQSKKAKTIVEIGPSGQSYTPMEKQIRKLKEDNPGVVLMIETGYKYIFYMDDADVAAKELGMVAHQKRNFLVASIPVGRKEVHLKKLLAKGYKVGIVAQTETAALKKISDTRNELFERKLTELYTSNTYTNELGSADQSHRDPPPLMCIIEEPNKRAKKSANDVSFGMITIAPTTGDVIWDDFDDSIMRIELETRIVHSQPSELLISKSGLSEPTLKMLKHFTGTTNISDRAKIEEFKDVLSYDNAFSFVSNYYTNKRKEGISESFKSGKLMAEVTSFPNRVVIALAHAIKYLEKFNTADALLETKFFTQFTSRTHMLLAANTLTNLEIYRNETDYEVKGSLLWILDHTETSFGGRLLKNWIGRPLIDKRALEERIDAVEEIRGGYSEKFTNLRQVMRRLPDLAKGLARIQYGQCTPKELAVLMPAFSKVANVFQQPFNSPADVGFNSPILNEIIFALPQIQQPVKEILEAFSVKEAAENNKIAMWTDPERYFKIADADMAIQQVKFELKDELKSIRKILRIPSLEYESWGVDDYLIKVKRRENRPVPDNWILHSKNTVYARYQTPTVRKNTEEMKRHQERLEAAANEGYSDFLAEIASKHYAVLRNVVNKLAVADCLFSLALVALQENYVRPTFVEEDVLEIVDGRHPMIETLRSDPFVPNSICMGGGEPRNKIITGPNMGGKSSCVRMIALISVMAQIGSYVPATSCKLRLLDSVHTRMGASDDLARGRSTFMVEMSETSEILHSATENSLVILDELGRGTSTFDGMAVADAVMRQLVQLTKCRTLFITHYPLVASTIEKEFPSDVQNLHMGYEEDTRVDSTREITFLYRLTPGMASESFGIECGRLAGLPEPLLAVAAKYANQLRVRVDERTKQNRIRKATRLVKQCLTSQGIVAVAALNELQSLLQATLNVE